MGRRSREPGRVAVVAARFNGEIADRLLSGALEALRRAGVKEKEIDVFRVAGAFELPSAVQGALRSGRYRCAVALGAVIRGETPHFEHVARTSSDGLARVALETGLPVGFGVLTCDTPRQALARAGGDKGNKGIEAAKAALEMADLLDSLR